MEKESVILDRLESQIYSAVRDSGRNGLTPKEIAHRFDSYEVHQVIDAVAHLQADDLIQYIRATHCFVFPREHDESK